MYTEGGPGARTPPHNEKKWKFFSKFLMVSNYDFSSKMTIFSLKNSKILIFFTKNRHFFIKNFHFLSVFSLKTIISRKIFCLRRWFLLYLKFFSAKIFRACRREKRGINRHFLEKSKMGPMARRHCRKVLARPRPEMFFLYTR